MPEENQTRLVYLNSCSSSFCVLTLTLSQNPRFCSHFLLEREINDKRGGCLWHSSTRLQIPYKILLPWARQKPASWRQFLRRGSDVASHQCSAQQDSRRFSQHHLPCAYSCHNLHLASPPPSRVHSSSGAACVKALSRQRALHHEVSLKAPAAGRSIELTESISENFREKLNKSSQGNLKAQKGEDKRTPNVLSSLPKNIINVRAFITLGLADAVNVWDRLVIFRSRLH